MSSEEFIRYVCTLILVVGVSILAVTLGSQFGLWAAGAVLIVTGAGIGIPLWRKHFEILYIDRIKAEMRPTAPPKATEEFPV